MMHHDEHSHWPPGGDAHANIRSVWDPVAECTWRVWAADCRDVPGARGRDCLIFDAGTTVRRLWSPPAGWDRLADDALLALLDARPNR